MKKTAWLIWILLLTLPLFAQSNPKNKTKTICTGTATGKINTTITNDYGVIKNIDLAGLKVRLLRKYGGGYYTFGETYTDENGNFTIPYHKTKNGKKVKLYLRVFASTHRSYNIKSKKNGTICKYNNYIGTYKKNAGTIDAPLTINENTQSANAFRCVHWARKGMKYFRENSVSMPGGLKIKINKMGSWATTHKLQQYPVIHIKKNDGKHENTIYHEFGHYVMYRLQNNHIRIPYGEKGVNNHGWRTENTGLLAWNEGWASAVMMILDAAHWQEDEEYGLRRKGAFYELLERFETINNGLRSEYHIANAIYDLWDGADKGLPETLLNGSNNRHGWNDSCKKNPTFYSWQTIDNVSLTLAQICAPLQTVKKRADLKNLHNIGDYYNALLSQFTDCKDKADVGRVFKENRIVFNVKDPEKGTLSLDNFYETVNLKEKGFLRTEIPFIYSKWTDEYKLNIPFGKTDYSLYALPNTSLALIDDYRIGIDDKNKNETIYFYLNPHANSDKTNLKHGRFYTCGENKILVNNGVLELGAPNSNYTADLTINENSLLDIEKKGKLVIYNNCTLRIASGGTVQIKNQSVVTLVGNASIVVEKGGILDVEESANITGKEKIVYK